eukprot:TRINITY_DN499_c0_g1_i1.p1 TRINITY_DN499_c0_g1~~TRINITY_DN499_c0_g1_i1.p1  ORF type:complete len:122 (-),score=51.90 TRINITY_DN499_c0_g1_i1:41-406(-)
MKYLAPALPLSLLSCLFLSSEPVLAKPDPRPQTAERLFQPVTVEQVAQDRHDSVLAEFVPNCHSLFRRSLPECQAQAQTYGKIWGEITVEVSSPLLIVSEPGDRKKKRKEKKKKKQQQQQV